MDENETQLKEKDIKVLRTYTSDMAEAIKEKEMSVIKIALAEKQKKDEENLYRGDGVSNFSKNLLITGGVILIILAIVGSYFLFRSKNVDTNTPIVVNNVDTFISYDSKIDLDVTNVNNVNDLSNLIKEKSNTEDNLIKIFNLSTKTNEGVVEITSKNFLTLTDVVPPDALVRSLSDKYLLGKYKSSLFLIFETTNYPQAYASMLDWEKTNFKDLFVLFDIKTQNSNDTLFDKGWKDIIIDNRDARVLYGENGEGILYYVFINKKNFIITNNIETLKEITKRIIDKNTKSL